MSKFNGSASNTGDMQRAQLWFLEAVKQSGFKLYESAINMLEAAIYHTYADDVQY